MPVAKKGVKPVDKKSRAEIALRLACRDIARINASGLATPLRDETVERLFDDYMKKAGQMGTAP